MARISGENRWWGELLYWLTTAVAAIIAISVVVDFFIGWAQGYPVIRVVALIAAVVIWLIGRIGRSLLSQV